MTDVVLTDLFDHPAVPRYLGFPDPPFPFQSPDLLSFHEVFCDLARLMAKDPDRYAGIPIELADLLESINDLVLKATYRIVALQLRGWGEPGVPPA